MTLKQEILIKENRARKEGVKKGIDIGRRNIAKEMKHDGEPIEKIIRHTLSHQSSVSL